MLQIFGTIKNPTTFADGPAGFFNFLSVIFKLAGTVAGIFFIIQIIIAGYNLLSTNGDEKKTIQSWAIIWQSLIGITIVASAFVIASVIGNLIGINILNPTINGPSK